MAVRRRLDAELVRRGSAPTIAAAELAVAAKRVLVNGAVAELAARLVAAGDAVTVTAPPPRFVGRGGEKLDAALERFGVGVTGLRVLDVGASTGGFTDALLSRGARAVVALDVGHGQLHPRIRHDERVTVLERTNIRSTTTATIGGLVDVVVADVSFISLTKIIPTLVSLCHPGSPMILLVKPQFEADRAEAGRGRGVITDPAVRRRVRGEIENALEEAGSSVLAWMDSPLRGSAGNRELFVHAVSGGPGVRS